MRIRSYVVLLVLLLLTGCGRSSIMQDIGQEGSNMTWQDYYDLGIRYLSEGNYQEAIIAFTAAIEIDPKLTDAYMGRGRGHLIFISGGVTITGPWRFFAMDRTRLAAILPSRTG